jgi:Tfp pilus assembly protein PilX
MIKAMKKITDYSPPGAEQITEQKQEDLTSEKGFISLFSVLIIMAILTLIAVGFSAVVRRAQQRVLDNQLNTQAFYAAESGVNDAKAALEASPALTKTTCQGGTFTGYNNGIDAGLNVGYTCLLINSTDPKLIFNAVPLEGTANPKTVNFQTSTGAAVSTFDVTWSPASGSANIPPAGTGLVPSTTWAASNYLGMVRIDLVPVNQGLDRDSLARKSFSFFLYPTLGGGFSGTVTTINDSPDQGGLAPINCIAAPCTAHMRLAAAGGLPGSLDSRYTMRVSSVYAPVNVTISNGVDVNGVSNSWSGGQAVIDSTGKANDVFRRIQVRIPLDANGLTPAFAIQSADSICKVLLAKPGDTHPDPAYADPACAVN